MAAGSLIIGVDLAPIKPIPRTITFQSDITTDQCRAMIRQHLKSWKADTVLHDGAPNVGTAWVQDAFSQAELALQAFKLAAEFLTEGGTFVTKVFRSKDYNALLWIFKQLFNKVEATKPPSSRNVSAEIFVVCQGFKAPKHIDPNFLDPRSVFAEVSNPTPNNEAKVFNPEKKKRKREGYEEGNYTQFKEVPASDFVNTSDPIAMLGSLNKFNLEQPEMGDIALAALEKLPETSSEIRQCFQDLKVLGRKEFRLLLRWRLIAREKFGLSSKKKSRKDTDDEEVGEFGSMDKELQLQVQLQKLNENEISRKRRERRRENERKQKEIVRMQLHMMPPSELGMEHKGPNGEDSMFALAAVNKAGVMEKAARGKMVGQIQLQDQYNRDKHQEEGIDEEEDRLERELDAMYAEYQERRSESDAKYRAKRSRKEHNDHDWEGFSGVDGGSEEELQDEEESNSSSQDENWNRVISGLSSQESSSHVDFSTTLTRRASNFFDQEIFKYIGSLESDTGDGSNINVSSIDHSSNVRSGEIRSDWSEDILATNKVLQVQEAKRCSRNNAAEKTRDLIDVNDAKNHERVIGRGDNTSSLEILQATKHSEWDEQDKSQTNDHLGK